MELSASHNRAGGCCLWRASLTAVSVFERSTKHSGRKCFTGEYLIILSFWWTSINFTCDVSGHVTFVCADILVGKCSFKDLNLNILQCQSYFVVVSPT